MSSRIPRLEFNQISPALQEQLKPRVTRLGYFGEFFKCTAHQPDLLGPFMTMTENFKKVLPQNVIEVGALTVAGLMKNPYERHQHERLCLKLGFAREWVAAINQLDPDRAARLDDTERAVQRFAMAMVERRGKDVTGELDAVIDVLGPEQAIALMFLVGRYVTHALIVNGLGLEPPVPSPLVEEVAR